MAGPDLTTILNEDFQAILVNHGIDETSEGMHYIMDPDLLWKHTEKERDAVREDISQFAGSIVDYINEHGAITKKEIMHNYAELVSEKGDMPTLHYYDIDTKLFTHLPVHKQNDTLVPLNLECVLRGKNVQRSMMRKLYEPERERAHKLIGHQGIVYYFDKEDAYRSLVDRGLILQKDLPPPKTERPKGQSNLDHIERQLKRYYKSQMHNAYPGKDDYSPRWKNGRDAKKLLRPLVLMEHQISVEGVISTLREMGVDEGKADWLAQNGRFQRLISHGVEGFYKPLAAIFGKLYAEDKAFQSIAEQFMTKYGLLSD